MLHKTKGIVLKHFKYRDTSIVVKILTEVLGVQTYVVNGVRSKNAKSKIALYQPLTLLDLVVYYKANAEMNRISEVKCYQPYESIPYDISKSAIGVFLAEVLYKAIREEGEHYELFEFIQNSLIILDHMDNHFENFHIQFMLKLTKYLGFGIDFHINKDAAALYHLLNEAYKQHLPLKNADRKTALDFIVTFYQNQIDSMGQLKSLEVLRAVL